MFTNLSAVQINRLAQRLSEAPLGRSASVAAAAERFERLLAAAVEIGQCRLIRVGELRIGRQGDHAHVCALKK